MSALLILTLHICCVVVNTILLFPSISSTGMFYNVNAVIFFLWGWNWISLFASRCGRNIRKVLFLPLESDFKARYITWHFLKLLSLFQSNLIYSFLYLQCFIKRNYVWLCWIKAEQLEVRYLQSNNNFLQILQKIK